MTHQQRNIGTFGFAVIWIGMAIVLAAFAIGGSAIMNLSLPMVIVATLVGSCLIGVFMTLIGDIGIEHGLSFLFICVHHLAHSVLIYLLLYVVLQVACWFGLNTYFGALAINGILNLLFGFDNWFICFLVFAAFNSLIHLLVLNPLSVLLI